MTSNIQKEIEIKSESRGSASDIISVPEACDFLGVHRNTLYKLIQAKEVPAFRMIQGGRWKFRKNDLEQWLEDKQMRSML